MRTRGIYAPPDANRTRSPANDGNEEKTTKNSKHNPDAKGVTLDPSDAAFLEAGKENGVWFKIPQEIYDKVHAHYGGDKLALDEALEKLAAIQSTMDEINSFLRRPDVTDVEKQRFLTKFMANQDVSDYDEPGSISEDSEKAAAFGTLVAKLYDPDDMFGEVLDDGDEGFWDDTVELDEIHKVKSLFQDQFIDWMEKNDIDLEQDKTWQEFAEASLMADEIAERRKGMSWPELMEDIQRVKEERKEAIKESKRNFA